MLTAMNGKQHPSGHAGEDDSKPAGGAMAAGVLASSAIIAEGVQIAGTAVLLYLAQQWTGASSPVEAVGLMIDFLQGLGPTGYAVFGAAMIFLQVVPVAAAFVLTVSAGAIFGTVKGTAIVSVCSTVSASISFLIARSLGRNALLEASRSSCESAESSTVTPPPLSRSSDEVERSGWDPDGIHGSWLRMQVCSTRACRLARRARFCKH